jgi:hypothetical protein
MDGTYDSAAQTRAHISATEDTRDHTRGRGAMKVTSASTAADRNLRQEASSTPAIIAPGISSGVVLLLARDETKIMEANAQRNQMDIKKRRRLDEALEIAIRGKRSLTGRLRPWTTWRTRDTGNYDHIEGLLDSGADPNSESFGARLCAIELNNARRSDVLHLLLLRGASFDLSLAIAWLCTAASHGSTNLVKDLLDSGVSPNGKFAGSSPQANATIWGRDEVMWFLLDRGAIVDDGALIAATSNKRLAW